MTISAGALSTWTTLSSSELNTVLGSGPARVKVVRAINFCGQPGTNIAGCAYTPGPAMTVVRVSSNEDALWLHEYGHNTGLVHNNDNRFIMYGVLGNQASEDIINASARRLRSLFMIPQRYRLLKIDREKVRTRAGRSHEARKLMGELPTDVLSGASRAPIHPGKRTGCWPEPR